MEVSVNDRGDIVLTRVFSGIVLVTNDGERMAICMRDTGFDIEYEGKQYVAQKGVISIAGRTQENSKQKDQNDLPPVNWALPNDMFPRDVIKQAMKYMKDMDMAKEAIDIEVGPGVVLAVNDEDSMKILKEGDVIGSLNAQQKLFADHAEEMQKCKDSPAYFYNKYMKREGMPDITDEEFNKFSDSYNHYFNSRSKRHGKE